MLQSNRPMLKSCRNIVFNQPVPANEVNPKVLEDANQGVRLPVRPVWSTPRPYAGANG
jgi:hypothetical protein